MFIFIPTQVGKSLQLQFEPKKTLDPRTNQEF